VEKGFRLKADSIEACPASNLCSELIHSREIRLFEVRVFFEDLFLVHSGAKPSEDIPNGYAQATDTRFSTAFIRLDRDPAGARRWHCKPDCQQYATARKKAQDLSEIGNGERAYRNLNPGRFLLIRFRSAAIWREMIEFS